jgi:RNA polymerase sigma factor (sigma-70 family)
MLPMDRKSDEHTLPRGSFVTTRWSVVLRACQDESLHGMDALEELCRAYWYPLYAHVRGRGYGEADAQDLVQGFFAHLLERGTLGRVAPEKGRFRSFLLGALNYFLANERERTTAQKRGGGREVISFDAQDAGTRYELEPVNQLDPARLFERRWALALLDRVLARLEAEFRRADKQALFEALRPLLVEGESDLTYREIGLRLGLTEEAVKKTAQRLRRRYQELFRDEVADTLADPGDLEDEVRHLCSVMSL